jgi:hypothetical protein
LVGGGRIRTLLGSEGGVLELKSKQKKTKKCGIADFEHESDTGAKIRAKSVGKAKSEMKKKPQRSKSKKPKVTSDAGSQEIQESKPKRTKSKKAKESSAEDKPKKAKKYRIAKFQNESDIDEKIRAKSIGKAKSQTKKKPKAQDTQISVGVSEGKNPKLNQKKTSKKKTEDMRDEILVTFFGDFPKKKIDCTSRRT